jgi:hypothetical protein
MFSPDKFHLYSFVLLPGTNDNPQLSLDNVQQRRSKRMSMQEPIDTQEFLASFKGFMDQAVMQAPTQEPPFVPQLRTHFGMEPKDLPIVAEQFEKSEHPNLHVAITSLLEREGWSSELLGVVAAHEYMGVKIATLLSKQHGAEATPGPVEYINITLNDDRVLACVQSGIYLIRHGDQPLALLVRGPRQGFTPKGYVRI